MNELDKQIIEYIKTYGIEHGYLPTTRDVADGLNITHPRAFYRFKVLEKRGWLKRDGQKYSVKGLRYVRDDG